MTEMKHVAETDHETMAKLLDEALSTRSTEALSIVLETAYCVGRRTGFAECGAMTREIIGRPSVSEGNGHG